MSGVWQLYPSDRLSIISLTVGLFVLLGFIVSGIKIHSHSHDSRLHFHRHFGIHFFGTLFILYFNLYTSINNDDGDQRLGKVLTIMNFCVIFLCNLFLNHTAYSFYRRDNTTKQIFINTKGIPRFYVIMIIFIIAFCFVMLGYILFMVIGHQIPNETNTLVTVYIITIINLLHSGITAYYSDLSKYVLICMSIFFILCIIGGPAILNKEWGYYLMIFWWPFGFVILSWILLFYHKTQKQHIPRLWINVLILAISIFDLVTDVNIIIVSFQSENRTIQKYAIAQLSILLVGVIFCTIFVNEFYYPGLENKERRIAKLWTLMGFGRLWHNILSWDMQQGAAMVCFCTQFILAICPSTYTKYSQIFI